MEGTAPTLLPYLQINSLKTIVASTIIKNTLRVFHLGVVDGLWLVNIAANFCTFFFSVLLCFAQVATSMCKSLNISDNDLHSCIFDVAITNDTTFTDQETFKRGKVL